MEPVVIDKTAVENAEIDSRITKTMEAVKQMNEATAKAELILSRQILSGKSDAGTQQAPELSDAEKKKQGAIEFFKGSAIEEALKING